MKIILLSKLSELEEFLLSYEEFINNLEPWRKSAQIAGSKLLKKLYEIETKRELDSVVYNCKNFNNQFDLENDYYKIIFLKFYFSKNKNKKHKIIKDISSSIEKKINKCLNQEEYSKLYNYLETNNYKYFYYSLYVKNFFKIFNIIKNAIGKNDGHKMYFCDLFNEKMSSEKRVEKLKYFLDGVYGSYSLSILKDTLYVDYLSDFISCLNSNFDRDVEKENVHNSSIDLYFSEHRYDVDQAEKQFIKYHLKNNTSMSNIDHTCKKLKNIYKNRDFEKHQNVDVLYKNLKEKYKKSKKCDH